MQTTRLERARRLGVGTAVSALVAAAAVVGFPTHAVGEGPPIQSVTPLLAQERPDRDGDGLYDDDETDVYGTDPDVGDTDGDGADDGQEVYDGTDPLSPNGAAPSCPDGQQPNGGYCPTPTYVPSPTYLPSPTSTNRPSPTPTPVPSPTFRQPR